MHVGGVRPGEAGDRSARVGGTARGLGEDGARIVLAHAALDLSNAPARRRRGRRAGALSVPYFRRSQLSWMSEATASASWPPT